MATINVRTDDKLKNAAGKILKTVGLDMSNAVKLFLHQVVITKSIPFAIRTENGFTVSEERCILEDIIEAKKQIKAGNRKLYTSSEDMVKDFLK